MKTVNDREKPFGASERLPTNHNFDHAFTNDDHTSIVSLKITDYGQDNNGSRKNLAMLSSVSSSSPSPTASIDIQNPNQADNQDHQTYQPFCPTRNGAKRVQFNELAVGQDKLQQHPVINIGKIDSISSEIGGQELVNFNNLKTSDSIDHRDTILLDCSNGETLSSDSDFNKELKACNDFITTDNKEAIEDDGFDQDDNDEDDYEWYSQSIIDEDLHISDKQRELKRSSTINSVRSPSRYKPRLLGRQHQQQATYAGRAVTKLKFLTTGLTNKILGTSSSYTEYSETDNQDLLTGATKYDNNQIDKQIKRSIYNNSGRTFRGSYRYSRFSIVMAVFKKLFNFLIQRSTLALFGAFLIHVTLGTVYTLSNINSYLTSYMRKHGTPNATYGGSMWISSTYAVGQGLSMVLGGYLERKFSARFSCMLGCALHSISIMSTSKSIDHGHLAVLLTYGFLPGFGCGLSYMTPMSNGFGWFPNRKGLVAGVILAGFGIGTFVFNMAQTAFVNPENLSPSDDSGYFNQESILNRVPQLFIFLGSIYATMQFIGCCLLFKPPNEYNSTEKSSDLEPILVDSELTTLHKAVRSREFIVLFLVFGITNQGVLFVNSMLKEYGQIFIKNDLFLAWTGSMASIANSLGRLTWGLAIDRFTFTQCFTAITTIFGALMFLMPFEFVLSSKLLYLLCTLGIFGSFSGWMSTYPVHLSRVFGVHNSGVVYGLIFVSQSIGGILTAFGAHYLIDNYSRFVPFFCVTFLEILGLAIYHSFYNK